jgi:hypothetical protein
MKHLSNFRMAMAAALMCLPILFASCSKEEKNNNTEPFALDPLLQWGCSIADVEQHMQSKDWWADGNNGLEYWGDPFESWHKWYWVDSTDMLTEQYLFETEEGQNLRYVVCICWNTTVPVEKALKLLSRQGFHATGDSVLFDGENYFDQHLSADGQTEALTLADNDGWYITYRPFNHQQR